MKQRVIELGGFYYPQYLMSNNEWGFYYQFLFFGKIKYLSKQCAIDFIKDQNNDFKIVHEE